MEGLTPPLFVPLPCAPSLLVATGKTTLVETAVAGRPGIVSVTASAGASDKEIVAETLTAITRSSSFTFGSVGSSALRVVAWHTRFFGVPPTVVLRVRERRVGQETASVGSAVRTLVGT
jgi:hypothetical protein